ncbi:MAG: hypothetical protein FJY95_13360 [Candidatus Handelsmanbacteria bacterium]|nr:hypothetical protein [Candidatus Handelsmanbacteria bacterium]
MAWCYDRRRFDSQRGLELLRQLAARRVWFTEYAADEPFLHFARSRGFSKVRRFPRVRGLGRLPWSRS